jgi:hypothetical protein
MNPATVDSLERILWTIIQAIVAILIVEVADIDVWWGAMVMAGLVTVKTQVARHIGPSDAAIIPASLRTPPSTGDPVDQE